MTSVFFGLIRLLGPRAVTTMDNPNSWAVVSLWRAYFQNKQEEEERQMLEAQELLAEALDISVETHRPVASDNAVEARRDMARDYFRSVVQQQSHRLYQLAQEQRRQANAHSGGGSTNTTTTTTMITPMGITTTTTTMNGNISMQQRYQPNLDVVEGERYLTLPQ